MKISILCSSMDHPIRPRLKDWCRQREHRHQVELVQRQIDLTSGDILFLISCHELIRAETRSRYRTALVIHAGDLPEGRGWSPHIWQILAGRNEIAVTILEAEDKVDSGAIWAQRIMRLAGDELYDEINAALFTLELELMDYVIDHFTAIVPRRQDDRPPTYFRRRSPEDSRLDPFRPLSEQFDLLRTTDPVRFPAFFDYREHRYIVRIEKADDYAVNE